MGTKVQCKGHLPGYCSMRDLNEDSNSSNWSVYYGDKILPNGQYYDAFLPRTVADVYTMCNKDVVKQTMLEHEAIFRNQVYELHRLYRTQRDLMDEVRRKGLHTHQAFVESLFSSSTGISQMPTEDSWKWQVSSFVGPSVSSADNIPSPLNFMKGKSVQASPIASQSRQFSKDCEVLGSRPSKVRRKMFDLQLPADEYIDIEEVNHCPDEEVPYTPGNYKTTSESSEKLLLWNSGKPSWPGNATCSNSCIRSTKDLADLNEPIQLEERSAPASVDFVGRAACRTEFQYMEIYAKSKSQFLGVPHHGSDGGTMDNQPQDCKVKGREWLSYMLDAGHSQSNQKSISQGLQQELVNLTPQPLGTVDKAHELSTLLPNDQSSRDVHREKTLFGLEVSRRGHDLSSYSHLAPLTNCHPENNPNPACRSVLPNRNSFYHGSSSGSKEQLGCCPSGFDYMSCKNYMNQSNCVTVKSEKDVTWSTTLSSTSSNGAAPQKGIEVFNGQRKYGDHGPVLPWLTAKPASKNEVDGTEVVNGPNQIFVQNIASASSVCDDKVNRIDDSGGNESTGKILGVPIFEKLCISRNKSSFASPFVPSLHPHEGGDIENTKSKVVPDINVASDPMVFDLKKDSKVASIRDHIDLNSCMSEEEVLLAPSPPICGVKIRTEIDLEAPVVPEAEEDITLPLEESQEKQNRKSEDPLDELVKVAAAALVDISSSSDLNKLEEPICDVQESPLTETLNWFVEVAFSCWDDLGSKKGGDHEKPASRCLDYFEFMTLKLQDADVDEHLPKPQILDNLKGEETGTVFLPSRPRKGQARRGRQRRDFQRDILPGLVSLSRHEVTEDLQTFGGLMKAMGHSWQSGPTRRNATRSGCARGRRRSVASPTPTIVAAPVCAIEVGLEQRSLTGWGKTTRRPRRQRCPAGNPVSPPMT